MQKIMLQETKPDLQSQDKFYPAIQDFLLMYANNLLFPFAKPDNLIPILEITKIQPKNMEMGIRGHLLIHP